MNSLLYYYNNVQKMAAYRQAKRMQRGVKLGYNSTVEQNTTKFQSLPISILTNDFSIEFFGNTYGSEGGYKSTMASSNVQFYSKGSLFIYRSVLGTNGVSWVIFERPSSGEITDDSLEVNWKANGEQEKFHLIITRQGTTVNVYINGELKATKEQSAVKDLGDLQLAIANSSDVGFVRVWNYALSADDVTAHYNNGDPMGYVVPKAMREIGPEWEIINQNCEFTLNSPDNVNITDVINLNSSYLYELKYTIDEYDFDPDSGYRAIGATVITITGASSFAAAVKDGLGVTQTCFIRLNPGQNQRIIAYAGISSTYTTRNLKLTILSLRPVGLLAEYLPQNLMASRKGPEVEPTAETYEFNIGSPYSQTVVSGRQYPFDCIYRVDYVVDECDFQPKVFRLIGFVGTSGASVIAGVNSWIRKSDAKIGEVQSCFIKMPNEGNPSILLYGDQDTEEATARHLKVTIKGITPVSVPISWLDSAKQLPLSDEYMEPLFQSIGGYDMTANGAPDILYNE